jgi:hypothetical protein
MVGLVLREYVANMPRPDCCVPFARAGLTKSASARCCQNFPGYRAAARGRRAARRPGALASLSPRSTILQPVRARSDGRVCPAGASESSAHVCCMIRKASWRNSARHRSANSERALSMLMSYPHPCRRPRLSLPRATGTPLIVQAASPGCYRLSSYLPRLSAVRRPAAANQRPGAEMSIHQQ